MLCCAKHNCFAQGSYVDVKLPLMIKYDILIYLVTNLVEIIYINPEPDRENKEKRRERRQRYKIRKHQ